MLRKVLIVSFVFNIIFLISLLCVLWQRGHFGEESNENRSKCNKLDHVSRFNITEGQFCFSCNLDNSVRSNETLYSGILRMGHNEQLCCAQSDDHTREILSKVLKYRKKDVSGLDTNTALSPWFIRRNAIHTRLSLSANKVTWLADGQESSFQNGVSLFKNRLRVQREGLYFIYAAFTHSISHGGFVQSFYHVISKRHRFLPKNGRQILLMDKNGGGDMRTGLFTSFLCGTFNLKEGHEISVHISNITNVDTSEYSNYFGMFIL